MRAILKYCRPSSAATFFYPSSMANGVRAIGTNSAARVSKLAPIGQSLAYARGARTTLPLSPRARASLRGGRAQGGRGRRASGRQSALHLRTDGQAAPDRRMFDPGPLRHSAMDRAANHRRHCVRGDRPARPPSPIVACQEDGQSRLGRALPKIQGVAGKTAPLLTVPAMSRIDAAATSG